MRSFYAVLLFVWPLVAGCDLAEPDEPETTVYGFWDDTTSGTEAYTAVSAAEIVGYTSAGDCFNRRAFPAVSASDTLVTATDPETGQQRAARLDPADTDRMTLTLRAFAGDFPFAHERAAGDDPTLREVERLVCDD